MTLLSAAGDSLVVSANGSFSFSSRLPAGASYSVTVGSSPSGQNCAVTNGAGDNVRRDVTNVLITCNDRAAFREMPTASVDAAILMSTVRADAKALGLNVNNTISTSVWSAADLDGDGRAELIVGFSTIQPQAGSKLKVTEPVYSRLFVLGLDASGRLVDRTMDFIDGNFTMRAAPGGTLVADINGDGRVDIVFGTHQEDGRNEEAGSLMTAKPMALVSQVAGKHRMVAFGAEGWNLGNPQVMRGFGTERVIVINTGSEGWKGYVFAAAGLNPHPIDLSGIGGMFMRYFETRAGQRFLATTSPYPDVYSVRTFSVADNLAVRAADTATAPFAQAGVVAYTTWQGSTAQIRVITDGSRYFLGGGGFGISDACLIRMTPSSDVSLIGRGDMLRLLNYTPGQAQAGASEQFTQPFAFQIEAGRLVSQTLNLNGFERASGQLFCGDLNGDGYEDLWVQTQGGNQETINLLVYINNRNGGFERVATDMFPTYSVAPELTYLHVVVADLDGDGVSDYATIASIGDGTIERGSMRWFKGTRRLQ